ncbi:hypothetical protein [Arsenicicoccus piscis]|uniref:hypothetical protein n=1 Tax=Arsenicicoccus piscis TaxID=673954 RepID=UPI0024E11B5C|nr:hypothetical protein [Arsenicicoccus piscis]
MSSPIMATACGSIGSARRSPARTRAATLPQRTMGWVSSTARPALATSATP